MESTNEKDVRKSYVETGDFAFGEGFGEVEDDGWDFVLGEPNYASCMPLHPTPYAEETESDEEITSDQSYATKRAKAMKMKWMTLTGRKPLTMPLTMVYRPKADDTKKEEVIIRFGERRPLIAEQKRKENWMKLKMRKEMARSYKNLGRVLREVRLMEEGKGLKCLRFSPAADTMATSFRNGEVQIRNPETGEVILSLQTVDNLYRLGIPALRYHPKFSNRLYVGGQAGIIQLFDTENIKYYASVREKNNEICNLDLSADGSLLVSVGKDGNIYVYDASRLRLVSMQRKPLNTELPSPENELMYHYMRIFGLKYHPTDPNIFVTGGWDNTVKVWDTRVCGAVNSIYGPRICGDSIDVRGNEILTGSWTATDSLKLWDLSSGKIVRSISIRNRSSPVDGDFIYVARFFTGLKGVDAVIVGGNGTDEVQVVDIENEMAFANFPALKAVTALDSIGNIIAYGGMESVLRFGYLQHP